MILRLLAGFSALSAFASAASAQTAARTATPVQSVALPGYQAPVYGRWLSPEEDGSGVPLGGLGTGFMELRPDGRIHDVQLQGLGGPDKSVSLRLSATLGANPPITLVSSVGLPGSPAPHRYLGHYPVADLDYGRPTPAPVSVWCRALAPFVPGDARLSNTPAAVFSLRLKNGGPKPLPVTLRLSMQAGQAGRETRATPFDETMGDMRGLLLRGEDVSFALAGTGGNWLVKTGKPSFVEIGGRLPGGAEKTLTFALAWHAPEGTGRDGKRHQPNYAARYPDAEAVARDVLAPSNGIEAKIVAWQEKIYREKTPGWLKDALINSLYLLARDTLWYADGLYLSEQQGKVIDAAGSRLDGGLPLLLFFPQLELQGLRRLAARQAESGEIPGRLGQEGSLGAPIFGPGRTLASAEFVLLCRRASLATGDRAFGKELFPAVKRAMQFAMTLDADSDGLINEPALPAALASLDRYRRDWLWHGTASHTAFTGLAALRAAEQMAKGEGDLEFAEWCRAHSERGQKSLMENLWTGRYFRLYTDPDGFRQSDSSYLAASAGQVYAWLCDLGDLAETASVTGALETAGDIHAAKGVAEVAAGMLPEGKPDESGAPYSASTVPRDVWLYSAATLYAAGRSNDTALRQRALELAERAYQAMSASGTLWRQHSLYRSGDLAPAGDPHYFGNLAIWALPSALEGRPAGGAASRK